MSSEGNVILTGCFCLFSMPIVETLKTVNVEDDETVPHSDYVTIGLVGKKSFDFWRQTLVVYICACFINLLIIGIVCTYRSSQCRKEFAHQQHHGSHSCKHEQNSRTH